MTCEHGGIGGRAMRTLRVNEKKIVERDKNPLQVTGDGRPILSSIQRTIQERFGYNQPGPVNKRLEGLTSPPALLTAHPGPLLQAKTISVLNNALVAGVHNT